MNSHRYESLDDGRCQERLESSEGSGKRRWSVGHLYEMIVDSSKKWKELRPGIKPSHSRRISCLVFAMAILPSLEWGYLRRWRIFVLNSFPEMLMTTVLQSFGLDWSQQVENLRYQAILPCLCRLELPILDNFQTLFADCSSSLWYLCLHHILPQND